jgi:hypothetical protein
MIKKALYAVMLERSEASRGGKKRQYTSSVGNADTFPYR